MADSSAEAGDPLDALAGNATAAAGPMRWVRLLADDIGPRRPTSAAERRAAERMQAALDREGLTSKLEPFDGYSTFAAPQGLIAALALAPALLRPQRRLLRGILALAAAAGVVTEASLTRTPISRALSRRPSQNLVSTIEPREAAERTLCLMCHLDTSRSGLLFDPRFARYMSAGLKLHSGAALLQGAEPILARSRAGRAALALSRIGVGAGAAVLAERELRGEDTRGANDNASGTAIVAELALDLVRSPLAATRVVILMTCCEESGLLGAQSLLSSHDTSGWLFLNFDNVGGDVPLRYLPLEGIGPTWAADPELCEIAAGIAEQAPELGLHRAQRSIGLTYDATPVLARGGRALTFVAADDDGVIPNYHWPTDTSENVSAAALDRALEVGRRMLAAVDRGDADTASATSEAAAART